MNTEILAEEIEEVAGNGCDMELADLICDNLQTVTAALRAYQPEGGA